MPFGLIASPAYDYEVVHVVLASECPRDDVVWLCTVGLKPFGVVECGLAVRTVGYA